MTLAIDHLMANPGAVQDVMGLMAQDRTRVEGILNLAVQDAEMRDHLMTLLKGMELGRVAPRVWASNCRVVVPFECASLPDSYLILKAVCSGLRCQI